MTKDWLCGRGGASLAFQCAASRLPSSIQATDERPFESNYQQHVGGKNKIDLFEKGPQLYRWTYIEQNARTIYISTLDIQNKMRFYLRIDRASSMLRLICWNFISALTMKCITEKGSEARRHVVRQCLLGVSVRNSGTHVNMQKCSPGAAIIILQIILSNQASCLPSHD